LKFKIDKRKKQIFFLLFYMVSLSAALAQDFYGLLDAVMDHPPLTRLSLTELQQTQLKLSSVYVYQDYYRESTPGIGDQSLLGNNTKAKLIAVNARGNFKYGVLSRFGKGHESFTNLDADLTVNTDYGFKHRDLDLHIVLANKCMLLGMGVEKRRILFTAPVLINKYPESEDPQMNRYFLDWLEPSFGNVMDVGGEFDLNGLQSYASLPMGSNLLLDLHFKISKNDFAPAISYVNSSNIAELKGERSLVFQAGYLNQLMHIGLGSAHWSLKPTLTIQNIQAEVTVENPLPAGVIDDFKELGILDFSRKSVAFGVAGQPQNLNLEAELGYSQWDAKADLTTPVLGRYWFFPIAHAARVQISGTSSSQRLRLHHELIKRKIRLGLNAGYQHAYFDLSVKGEAELEFNIRSVPIDSPLQFHLHVISLGAPMSYSLNSFTLNYEFNQIIPWMKRVDDGPLNFQRDDRWLDKKVRGGGQHTITLIYSLD